MDRARARGTIRARARDRSRHATLGRLRGGMCGGRGLGFLIGQISFEQSQSAVRQGWQSSANELAAPNRSSLVQTTHPLPASWGNAPN